MNNNMLDKKTVRREVKTFLNSLDKDYINFSDEAIYKNVISMAEYKNAKNIFCFVGRTDEINTSLIIKKALADGKIIVVPKCVDLGIMNAVEIKSLDDLESGKYGIKEPKKHCKILSPKDIDFGLIPCLTCNARGERLGYGAGFYDKYLKSTSFLKVVLCRDKIMRNDIPVDDYDILMDIVVSEKKIIKL